MKTSLESTLKNDGIAIIKTDTIYGIVGRADREDVVERIFAIKGRTPSKSPIILIDSLDQLFDTYSSNLLETITRYWPGKFSLILPSANAPTWIVRGNHSVAYRLPENAWLRELIRATGPLIAPSANPEGAVPATTIDEARRYFGDAIDWYEDGGTVTDNTPSTIISLSLDGTPTQIR